ncbi:MAG: hypothetical protein AB4040_09420 [Synechococcus sp.]
MSHSPQFPHAISERTELRLRDRIQIALAIADETLLRSMLSNCQPAIAPANTIGHISSAICIAAPEQQTVDGIVEYQAIHCLLGQVQDSRSPEAIDYGWNAGDYSRHTRYQSDTLSLANRISMHEAQALLKAAGYSSVQVEQIMKMPPSASHKSWWRMGDLQGQFTQPFLRSLKISYFANGTLSLSYRDAFEQFQPPCFHYSTHRVLVEIQPQVNHFARTLARINRHRVHQNVDWAILIADELSPYEASAFNNQGISLYPDIHLTRPFEADCLNCQNSTCPMMGNDCSPVTACKGFVPA